MILGQSSFRRILLSRLLVVSIPVLLLGVYGTYRKARSVFLDTARQNLIERSVSTGENIQSSIRSLEANLATASDSVVLKLGSRREQQAFLEQLAQHLSPSIQCVQLTDPITKTLIGSTCGNYVFDELTSQPWKRQQTQLLTQPDSIYTKLLLPVFSHTTVTADGYLLPNPSQLGLLLAAPVYDGSGQLRYILTIKSSLLQKESGRSIQKEPEQIALKSLSFEVAIINEEGTIVAHPLAKQIGLNIQQLKDSERLQEIVKSAIAGRQDFAHLFAFGQGDTELVAGYSSIPSPLSSEEGGSWAILAYSPIGTALSPLEGMFQAVQSDIVVALIVVLIASVLATLYIARELARPIEQLRDYTIDKEHLNSGDRLEIPQNFKIREFNQLALAMQDMVERLQAWGEEVVSAWKEAKNANQLKNEFLANTSHELRTPLNGIIGCIRIVKDGYCDTREEEKEFLQQADNAAIHLVSIINDILDIARIEAGKLSVSTEPVNLSKLIKEVMHLQLVPIHKKGLRLKTPHWNSHLVVYADPAKLKQVLLNVIGNAVKFTESGSISIALGLKNQERNNLQEPMAVVTIKDTGIGIDPHQQEKLFRPFVMIDGSTTRKFGGTGLGLAISRNLIELMGGYITLFSGGLGKGTTVEISLPLVDSNLVSESLASQDSQLVSARTNQ